MKLNNYYKVQLNTDCEGPTCLNDNAYELCKDFLNHGERLFMQLSQYDDILYLNKEKYKFIKNDYATGDTLRLILPFLRANDLNNKIMELFVDKIKKIKFMKGAIEGHRYFKNKSIPVFEISTSYAPFAYAVAEKIQVAKENVFCTDIHLDEYFFSHEEKKRINEFRNEIVNMPDISIPTDGNMESLDQNTKSAIERLNHIFWYEMPRMDCWGLISKTKVMNGKRKVEAIIESLKRTNYEVKNLVYVGDSITDREALRYVKDKGGLAVSFNGNSYAVDEAEIACIGRKSSTIAPIVVRYSTGGRKAVSELIENLKSKKYLKQTLPLELFNQIYPLGDTIVSFITDKNKAHLIEQSTRMRKEVRKVAGILS